MPPNPLTNRIASSPRLGARSTRIALTISSTIACDRRRGRSVFDRLAVDADAHFDFLVTKIEVRLPAAGLCRTSRQRHGARATVDAFAERLQFRALHSPSGGGADELLDDERARDAARPVE